MNGVVNRSVAVSNENGKITFLHQIIDGSADGSYGVHVAALAGIPTQVIERAQVLLNTPHDSYQTQSTIHRPTSKPKEQQLNENLETLIGKLKEITPDSVTPR